MFNIKELCSKVNWDGFVEWVNAQLEDEVSGIRDKTQYCIVAKHIQSLLPEGFMVSVLEQNYDVYGDYHNIDGIRRYYGQCKLEPLLGQVVTGYDAIQNDEIEHNQPTFKEFKILVLEPILNRVKENQLDEKG